MSIESRLQKLGLEGNASKLGKYTNLKERLNELQFDHKDTLVILGDTSLLYETITLLGDRSVKPLFGFIPIENESNFSQSMGIPQNEDAVLTLGNRRIEVLDLATVNNIFFIESISLKSNLPKLRLDDKFDITTSDSITEIRIQNIPNSSIISQNHPIIANDGVLDVILFETQKKRFGSSQIHISSTFKARKIYVSAEVGTDAIIDGFTKLKTPLTIGVKKQAIRFIVGKKRLIKA